MYSTMYSRMYSKRRKRSTISCMETIIEKSSKSLVGQVACSVCDNYIMGSTMYVVMLGLIGTVITMLDLKRIMNYKMSLGYLSRSREGETAPMNIERDLTLMTSILGIEHYTLIMLGAITEYSMFHTPWLLMQLCVIIVEIVVFFVRFFLEGLHVKRDEILLGILMIHNWLQVFCLFHRQARNSIE